MKKKKLKKKRKLVRERDWERAHETAFSHDRAKHRRARVSLRDADAPDPHEAADFTPNAVVIAHSKRWAFVQQDDAERLCEIDERLLEGDATLLAPGDEVLVEDAGEGGAGLVRAIAPRRTRLCRLAGPHARVREQVLAANADALIIVTAAARPPFREGLVDRYLIAAQTGGVEPILCINKMDLVEAEPPEAATYRELGLRVFPTSCKTGAGVDALRDALAGKLSVLSGHSGVGKSSLLNVMDPALTLHTREVSESTDRGKHTTTAARLYCLQGAIRIIDTPGIRALGLWGVSEDEVGYYFPDLAGHAAHCRFRDCTHIHEPDCAVRAAVEAGDAAPGRYQSYLRIRSSLASDSGDTPGRKAPIHGRGADEAR